MKKVESSIFLQYFKEAATSILTERYEQIAAQRYGLNHRKPSTLQEVGKSFGVSRERIRQLVDKSIRKIWRKGRRQLKNNETDKPCARFLLYLDDDILQHDSSKKLK